MWSSNKIISFTIKLYIISRLGIEFSCYPVHKIAEYPDENFDTKLNTLRKNI
jgi:hypothetical protein